eukprot:scaffold17691_cov72-Phaeocystis_antarctica.AAC.3
MTGPATDLPPTHTASQVWGGKSRDTSGERVRHGTPAKHRNSSALKCLARRPAPSAPRPWR